MKGLADHPYGSEPAQSRIFIIVYSHSILLDIYSINAGQFKNICKKKIYNSTSFLKSDICYFLQNLPTEN